MATEQPKALTPEPIHTDREARVIANVLPHSLYITAVSRTFRSSHIFQRSNFILMFLLIWFSTISLLNPNLQTSEALSSKPFSLNSSISTLNPKPLSPLFFAGGRPGHPRASAKGPRGWNHMFSQRCCRAQGLGFRG